MKLTDKIMGKYGADKLLHFLVAGWIVSLFSSFGFVPMLVSTIIVVALSIVKERCWDEYEDWDDMFAALCGIALSWIFFLIS